MAQFESELWLPCGAESLFAFLLRPANVQRISDPRLGLMFETAPDVVVTGSRIAFKVQAYGVVQRLEHEVVTVEHPRLIIEEQIKGPMKAWRHEHHLESKNDGVRMIDRVIFEPPGGMLGFLVKESTILDSLEDGFIHREQELRRLIGTGEIV
jgi:ligand-binding SRPBCC domain-containing protein